MRMYRLELLPHNMKTLTTINIQRGLGWINTSFKTWKKSSKNRKFAGNFSEFSKAKCVPVLAIRAELEQFH